LIHLSIEKIIIHQPYFFMKRHLFLPLAFTIVLLQCQLLVFAQDPIQSANGLRIRNVVPKPNRVTIDAARNIAGVFTMKFAEGSHIRLDKGQWIFDAKGLAQYKYETDRLKRSGLTVADVEAQLGQVSQVFKQYAGQYGFNVDYFLRDKSKQVNDAEQFAEKEKLEQAAGEELADLDLYYVIYAKDFKDAGVQEKFMNELNGFRIVEHVQPAVLGEGAVIKTDSKNAEATLTPFTSDISARQGYLNTAPNGIDARYAWTVRGGMGDNVRVIDIEFDWVTDHEDFPRNYFWGGRPACAYDGSGSEHGTAVMGVLAAPHNGFGISGIAPNVSYGLSSVCRPFDYAWAASVATFSGENWLGRCHNVVVSNAISVAIGALRPGDVMIIEQHVWGPSSGMPCDNGNCSQWEFVAMEYYQECFDIIRRATAMGIIVVEAAGNGGMNLDAARYNRRFECSFRNSQAILVGACNMGDREAADFTNYGSRIDVHGWGSGVVTLGYRRGDGEPFTNTPINRYYTCCFGGTSSASPIVAGAVASIQGVRRAAGQPVLLPYQMRDLLVNTGTGQASGTRTSKPIGPLPNLRAALTNTPAAFDPAGAYRFVNVNSNKVMEVKNYSRDNGGEICQWAYHCGDNQLWKIVAGPDGYFYIRSVLNNKNLEVYEYSTTNGGRLAQWDHTGANNQQWRLMRQADGSYILQNRHSNKVAEVYGLSLDNFAIIKQWDNWSGPNQKFRIEKVR
jgi:serine protease